MNKVWIANQGKGIYKYGSFGVSKSVVDLNTITNAKGYVRFLINGREYLFKKAVDKTNRVSGMGIVRNLFKGADEFQCEFDYRRKLIKVDLRQRTDLRHRISKQRITVTTSSRRGMGIKEKYFIRRMGLRKNDLEYKGNIRGSGYDFEIKGQKGQKVGKYVEVKGIDNEYHTINLTKTEYEFAKKHKRDYILYLIENWESKRLMYKVPFGQLNHEPDSHTFRFRKREIKSFEII